MAKRTNQLIMGGLIVLLLVLVLPSFLGGRTGSQPVEITAFNCDGENGECTVIADGLSPQNILNNIDGATHFSMTITATGDNVAEIVQYTLRSDVQVPGTLITPVPPFSAFPGTSLSSSASFYDMMRNDQIVPTAPTGDGTFTFTHTWDSRFCESGTGGNGGDCSSFSLPEFECGTFTTAVDSTDCDDTGPANEECRVITGAQAGQWCLIPITEYALVSDSIRSYDFQTAVDVDYLDTVNNPQVVIESSAITQIDFLRDITGAGIFGVTVNPPITV